MAIIDREIHKLYNTILNKGVFYEDSSREVTRLQIPSYTLRHEFSDGFPAITNKELYFKGIVGELIWFLRGDTDIKYLKDNKIRIWDEDAYNWHIKNGGRLTFDEFVKLGEGDVGQNYSAQWRSFNGKTDQILNLIKDMEANIMSTRLKVNAWNPSEIYETALPPCHSEFQVIGVPLPDGEFGFELHWNQRSVDTFLGLPFNIASYATLAKILEAITGYKALGIEGTLKCVHFYDNQLEAARLLLNRDPDTHTNCDLVINNPGFDGTIPNTSAELDKLLEDLDINMFKLEGYKSDEPIKVKMLSPNKL